MSIAKGKERVMSLTGSIIITAVIFTVLIKDTFPKVKVPDIFSDDRKKFKAYESQYRIYLWVDGKRGDWKNLKTVLE
jgi:hypothetical protein